MFLNALRPQQLALLDELSEIKIITDNFYLAGGTALALKLGHRESNDFDFFCENAFNAKDYINIIERKYNGIVTSSTNDTVVGIIKDVSISFFLYPYKLLDNFENYKNVRLASLKDLACMKFKALSQRGLKRDFYDIYEILKIIQPIELKFLMLDKYKSNGSSFYHLARCLVYFNDAEEDKNPISLNGTKWETVKTYLIKNQTKILKAFIE